MTFQFFCQYFIRILCCCLLADQYSYSLSYLGIKCRNIVTSKEMCKYAAGKIPKSRFTSAVGSGNDLPFGCVWYRCGVSGLHQRSNRRCNEAVVQHAMFWNPNGTVLSIDRNIRQVCFEPYGSFKGIYCEIYFSNELVKYEFYSYLCI